MKLFTDNMHTSTHRTHMLVWVAVFCMSVSILFFGAPRTVVHAQFVGALACTVDNLSACTQSDLSNLLSKATNDLQNAKNQAVCKQNINSSACKALTGPIQKEIDNINAAFNTIGSGGGGVSGASSTPSDVTNASNAASNNTKSSLADTPIPLVGIILQTLLYLCLMIVSAFITLAGYLIQGALSFNDSILNFDPPFIITGWTIFRDIANLGFVLGIIVIAVATILRTKGYQMQNLLWKIIVAALLVNFSLLIGGIFIKITNSVSAWLLGFIAGPSPLGTPGMSSAAVAKLGDSFGFSGMISGYSPSANFIHNLFGVTLGDLLAMVVLVIFGLIIFLALLGVAGMLFLRYFYLSFLLIVSPIVWLLWVFPTTAKYWKDWWKTFIHWSVYAPVLLLFIYISIAVMNQFSQYSKQVASTMSGATQFFNSGLSFGSLMTSLIAVALLVGGLKTAQKMGYGSAGLAIGTADRMNKWAKTKAGNIQKGALDKTKRGVQRTKRAALDSELGKKFRGNVISASSNGRFGQIAFGGMARSLEKSANKSEKASQGYIEDFKKNNKDLSPDQLKKLLPTLNKEQRIAAYEMLGEKNKLDGVDISNVNLQESLEHMRKLGRFKEAGDFEKKMGRSLNMVRLLQGQSALNKDGEEDPSITFPGESEKFFKGFSENDWKNAAQNAGKGIFALDKDTGKFVKEFAGMTKEQTDDLRKQYLTAIRKDLGKAIHSTVSKLQDQGEETIDAFFAELARGVSEEVGDATLKEELDKHIENKDTDAIADTLQKSSKPSISRLGKKIDKSMSSVLGGSYGGDEGGGKKDGGEEKKGDEGKK